MSQPSIPKQKKLPKDFIQGLAENWKADSLSGFLVFLIALPLSLGIAKASEFPPVMGLLTAIVGGTLVSVIAGSRLTIKGPAAGLIVIAAEAVTEFGGGELGWKLALGTIVVAGLIQILFGVFRLGSLSEFFPSSVIHGMLAAIGLIVISKQAHTLLGIDPKTLSGMEPLELFAYLPHSIANANIHITIVGLTCLLIVFGLPQIKNRFVKRIPSPVLVLLIAIPMAAFMNFKTTEPTYSMVKVGKFLEELKWNVDFSGWQHTAVFIKFVVLFALIGSIESLLTVKAIDGLDPFKRKSNANKDLIAVGIGNTFAGILGGLPMISEVARSSANVNNGAITRWANFFHGMFLLLAVIAIPTFIEMIPNAALAALLIGVGYRLASPKEFQKTFKIGGEQLIIFLVTIIFTLATDLLLGVFAGIFAKFIIQSMNGTSWKYLFKIKTNLTEKSPNHFELSIQSPATFSNLISFQKTLALVPKNTQTVIDFSQCRLADHTFMEMLHHQEDDFHENGGQLTLTGFNNHHYSSQHPLSMRVFLNNPEVSNRFETLTKRQKELTEYAQANGLEFEPRVTSKLIKLNLAPFALTKKTKNIENLLVGGTNDFNFFYADVYLEESAYLTNMGRNLTILFVSNMRKALPNFTLEGEGLFDYLGLTTKVNINFEAYPIFSKRYILSSDDEGGVRQFFHPDLITFLENENDIYIECMNNSVLIHSNKSVIPAEELDEYRKKIKKLVNLLFK
jgi:MFS superfamily sulfate permease-like transporter